MDFESLELANTNPTLHREGKQCTEKGSNAAHKQHDGLEQKGSQDFPGAKAKPPPALQIPCQGLVAPFLSSTLTDLTAPIFTWPPAPQQWGKVLSETFGNAVGRIK